MGCDIHICLEQKVKDKWVMVRRFEGDCPAEYRNYERFTALAGVRGISDVEPLGLPEDISDSAQLYVNEWEGDGHSHSWKPLQEAVKIFTQTGCNEQGGYAAEFPECFYFDIEIEDPKDYSNYRIIFFFDS